MNLNRKSFPNSENLKYFIFWFVISSGKRNEYKGRATKDELCYAFLVFKTSVKLFMLYLTTYFTNPHSFNIAGS